MLANKLEGAAKAATVNYVEDVFSTYLYNGTGASLTITNDIDLSGKGGMVWIKARNATTSNFISDTARGTTKQLQADSINNEGTNGLGITSFNTSGFTIGGAHTGMNVSGNIYGSWTFRKQSKFFDVVTYTGNGSNRTISHNLGSTPGCIIVKRTDTTGNWRVYHRSLTSAAYGIQLNLPNSQASDTTLWNSTAPTSSVFSLGTNVDVNANNGTYVAYLFAHDAGGFGAAGTDNVISCGTYTGDGNVPGPTITLNYEPQWILIKKTSAIADWYLHDATRGLPTSSNGEALYPNLTSVASLSVGINLKATGFQIASNGSDVNELGATYIYIAIRRGPMKTPTDATKVFQPVIYTGTNADNRLIDTTIAPDMVMIRQRNDTVISGMYTGNRLNGQQFLRTGNGATESSSTNAFDQQIVSAIEYGTAFSSMSGVWVGADTTRKFNANTTSNNHIIHAFKRAPGFFDAVNYVGTGANRTVTHNLGVAPELMLIKERSGGSAWAVYAAPQGNTKYGPITTAAFGTDSTYWNNTSPTSSVFTVGTNVSVNTSTSNYIAFLFASLSGVSKIGSYSGNGSSQTINCGFTNGARYVLIKRTDSTGDWFVYDSARGIVTGNDPQLKWTATTAEATGLDAIDPDNSGFIVNNDATNFPINVSGGTYIYLAIA